MDLSDDQIEAAINNADVEYFQSQRAAAHELVATKLSNGDSLAWYDGKMDI